MNQWKALSSTVVAALILASSLPAEETHALVYRYTKGQVMKYKVRYDMAIHAPSLQGGKITIQQEGYQVMTVDKVRDDGSAEIIVKGEDSVARVNNEAVPSKFLGFPDYLSVRLLNTSRGETLEATPEGEVEAKDSRLVENLLQSAKSMSFHLPPKPVKVGHTWQGEIVQSVESPGLGTIDLVVDLTFTFSSIETLKGYRCAVIGLSGSGNGAIGEGAGTIELKIKGSIHHALEEGMTVRTRTEEDLTFHLIEPEGPEEAHQSLVSTEELVVK